MTKARLTTQLEASFKVVDTNGDKNLNAAEIQAAQTRSIAQAQAAINKRVEEEFAKLDSNKDGQLNVAEFRAGAPAPRTTPAADLLRQMDSNKDGKVAEAEYRAMPLANFDRLDTNKDGTISAEEQAAAERRR
jgi:Ca2+-binding EF-hand superfamily protein